MPKVLVVCLLLGFLSFLPSLAGETSFSEKPVDSAETREEIIAAIDGMKGFGSPSWAEFSVFADSARYFVIWYCPFSGRAAVYAHIYYLDGKKWVRSETKFFPRTHTLSVTLDQHKRKLVYRSADDKVLYEHALRFPNQENKE